MQWKIREIELSFWKLLIWIPVESNSNKFQQEAEKAGRDSSKFGWTVKLEFQLENVSYVGNFQTIIGSAFFVVWNFLKKRARFFVLIKKGMKSFFQTSVLMK
jgi:hypothetical protein